MNTPNHPVQTEKNHATKAEKTLKKHTAGKLMPYSTELQRQKRAELRELRVQAEELEDQLAELQIIRQVHVNNVSLGSHGQNTVYWRSMAVVACEQRKPQSWDFLFKRLKSYCGSPSTTTTRKNTVNAVGYYGSVIREFYKLEATAVTQAKTQVQKTILDLVGNRMRIITQFMQETP
ncbi:hypothetical protein PPTG_22148 [Phytophthora nicotianae INRA-310]|uniref:Uncharacterized protein n=1 Tax=Phytophthora nicotianae (strain INRA-310) TaxID=761204 RepID=W2QN39_PHYN3|nr:hypothetical protein PPTG_22148 [Phytophthora nicotianae INRA-310]ETN14548.1 hypothetical protein PPTG_22148 [Phytophthora nicotianae INRA-310]